MPSYVDYGIRIRSRLLQGVLLRLCVEALEAGKINEVEEAEVRRFIERILNRASQRKWA